MKRESIVIGTNTLATNRQRAEEAASKGYAPLNARGVWVTPSGRRLPVQIDGGHCGYTLDVREIRAGAIVERRFTLFAADVELDAATYRNLAKSRSRLWQLECRNHA